MSGHEGSGISYRRRFFQGFRWGLLAVCVLALVLVFRRGAPPEIEVDAEAELRLEEKLIAGDDAAARGEAHSLRLEEAELNSWLASNLALADVPGAQELVDPVDAMSVEEVRSNVRDVKIDMVGDLLRAYVVFDFHGRDLSLLLEGHLRAEGGYLRFLPTAAQLGSLPLPQATLERSVGRLFDSPENREQFRLPPDVRDIRVADGQLVIDRGPP